MSGYKQDCGSFHGIYSWNLQLMEAMEAYTSTDSGKIHVRPWKLPLNFISANFRGNVHGSKYSSADIYRSFNESKLTSMEVNFGCTETSMGASGNVHGTKSKKGKNRYLVCTFCADPLRRRPTFDGRCFASPDTGRVLF